MNHLITALSGVNLPDLVAVFIPIAGIILGGVIAVSSLYFRHERRKLWHETARIALEKGQPVPGPAPDDNEWGSLVGTTSRPLTELALEQARAQRVRGLMIGGLVCIAVGAGLFFPLFKIAGVVAYFAAIPGFIGVALILAAIFDAVFSRKSGK